MADIVEGGIKSAIYIANAREAISKVNTHSNVFNFKNTSPINGKFNSFVPSQSFKSLSSSGAMGTFMTKYAPSIGNIITTAQIVTSVLQTVDILRKNIAIKSQNVSITEFGHDTGQRFEQYY